MSFVHARANVVVLPVQPATGRQIKPPQVRQRETRLVAMQNTCDTPWPRKGSQMRTTFDTRWNWHVIPRAHPPSILSLLSTKDDDIGKY